MLSSWITQSQIVFRAPGTLKGITLVAKTTGSAEATLHSGGEDAASIRLEVVTPLGDTRTITFAGGLPLPDGLFIKLSSHVRGVLLQWLPK